jgi:hypothetical protein
VAHRNEIKYLEWWLAGVKGAREPNKINQVGQELATFGPVKRGHFPREWPTWQPARMVIPALFRQHWEGTAMTAMVNLAPVPTAN